jgi:hypothetical protein
VDAEAFAAYVLSNAPRYDIDVLEKITNGLQDNIASRRWGKPTNLQIGSNIETTRFGTNYTEYGTVVGLSEKACTIQTAGSDQKSRVSYQKYAIRVLDDFEWNRVLANVSRWHEEYAQIRERESKEDADDRFAAVSDRDKERRKAQSMEALNGTFEIYRGAFIHAFRPDWDTHEYGVVVAMSPKKIVLSSEESEFMSSVWVAKHEIQLLDDSQWAIVDLEQRRRRAEYVAAEKDGRTDKLPDYSRIEIPLEVRPGPKS